MTSFMYSRYSSGYTVLPEGKEGKLEGSVR